MKKLHIYHINDLHSHFENWPKIRRFLLEKKAFHEMNGEEVLLFDIGDACDRVHPLTEATNGKANIELLNQVPFDAVTIGNNEGIGNDKRQLDELYDDAEFPVVLANLYDPETDALPTWAQPYLIKTL
ncbi:MAG: metallophosphoesterase, partial [Trichococcus flocculiformis]